MSKTCGEFDRLPRAKVGDCVEAACSACLVLSPESMNDLRPPVQNQEAVEQVLVLDGLDEELAQDAVRDTHLPCPL